MKQRIKLVLVRIRAIGRSLSEKRAFATIWMEASALNKVALTPQLRPRAKRILLRVPAFRRYLAEKHTLAACLTQAITERDEYQAALLERNAALEDAGAERDSLMADRDNLVAERQDLKRQLDNLRTVSIRVTAERDASIHHSNELAAATTRLKNELERATAQVTALNDERVHYQQVVLARFVTLQSELGTLQRSLARLSDVPREFVLDEVSRNLYLDLLENSLIGTIIKDESVAPWHTGYDSTRRELGPDWPRFAFTMIGKARMRNLRELMETALSERVAGDFLEAGVWRGGACIYMRGILKARGVLDRNIWVADSFAELPSPNAGQYSAERGDTHLPEQPLAVSLEKVRDNFSRYDLLDKQVRFLKGWFRDTLPNALVERLALLRLDGDTYESTVQTLDALYRKVSPGGFVIIDDYILPACKQAVNDFRARHRIMAKLEVVDGVAVYWRKPPDETAPAGRAVSSRKKQS